MAKFPDIRDSATSSIADFARPATLVKITNTGTDFNPDTSEETFAITLADVGFDISQRDGTLIQQQDKRFMVAANGESVEQQDLIRIGAQDFQIVNVTPIFAGETIAAYDVQARA